MSNIEKFIPKKKAPEETVTITVRVPAELHAAMSKTLEKRDLGWQEVMVAAIRAFLEEQK